MTEILFPLGRMIGGSVYKLFPRKDNKGNPKTRKDGTPDLQCSFGVAFPKTSPHWNDAEWGTTIWQVGSSAFPREHQFRAFAWKITDGDSTAPNKRGRIPAEQVGYPGHWVIWFSQGWAPKLLSADGAYELGPDQIYPGCFVRVLADVSSNKSTESPGVFINPRAVFLTYEGDKIETETEINVAVLNLTPVAMPVGARPVAQKTDHYGNAIAHPPALPPGALPPGAIDRGFLNVVAAPPPPPPRVPGPCMTAAAAGMTHAQFASAGWTDEQLIANGYMEIPF